MSQHSSICQNRKATHHYFIEEKFEAGIILEGWEVKSIRAGRINISESHIIFKHGAPCLIGSNITPLITVSTHIHPDPTRTRKLLMHRLEISRLIGSVERKGFTLVPLSFYWKNNHVKVEIGLARGKKQHDKRETEKQRDWERQKQRIMARG